MGRHSVMLRLTPDSVLRVYFCHLKGPYVEPGTELDQPYTRKVFYLYSIPLTPNCLNVDYSINFLLLSLLVEFICSYLAITFSLIFWPLAKHLVFLILIF